MEWKPLHEFLEGVMGNMPVTPAEFNAKLEEVKYIIDQIAILR